MSTLPIALEGQLATTAAPATRTRHPIAHLLLHRTWVGLLTLVLVSILVFYSTTILPGDAVTAALQTTATPQRVAALRASLHLDGPLLNRYWAWFTDVLAGKPGNSLSSGVPVLHLVGTRIVNTSILVVLAGLISSIAGVLLGVLAAAKRDKSVDHALSVVALTFVALPEFVVAIVLIIVFSTVVWKVFPAVTVVPDGASLWQYPKNLVLPVATLVLMTYPYLFRMVRAAMVEALDSEYVEMAEIKGLGRTRILFLHALPTVAAPVIQVIALNLLYLAGGIVVVEYVFNFPGIGQLLVASIAARDIPVIQFLVLSLAAFYTVVNIAADAAALAVTPRRRLPRGV